MLNSKTHQAAVLPQQGGPLSVQSRPTPEPGSNEVLIQVKAVAVNPIDHLQRDLGTPPVPIYPAVLGFDVSGVIAKLGSSVSGPPPGTRVAAWASSFFHNGSPDHGPFQEYVLVLASAIIALPPSLSFEQGAILPVGVVTALTAWTTLDIPFSTKHTPSGKQAVLIWGGSSSVGSYAIQSARAMGFTVYATASPQHHEYLQSLGATAVFDYKSPDVVAQIVSAVKSDGVTLLTAHCAVVGGLQPTLDVLRETKAADAKAKVVYSPALPADHPTLENTEIKFNFPPVLMDAEGRSGHFGRCMRWLEQGLAEGVVVPSPRIQVEGSGLGGINGALDKLREGVRGTKIVVLI